ncbi:MAG: hypothetical protein A2Y00_00950 [Omnitrophica WOR_2 bacterium GWF2_43_52]|nr:MAG: hypothetical protein A2Y01_07930 [Omnitrophica WOR_2 bacterium GWC2_44_8]OGX20636.1 MAG: hypothetical protein A2Y00_00950 [Omnitrophica WOR_2 bacterium GWF2_43_52]HAH22136.1 hypothetical protein [Candidatus Omnitrophota bacterium]HBG64153.1 hypothetical protein [Candidatus Omnitrophota bacterium]HCD39167.1 hypothetical protein [Candidatus Omnitrophota bacterium]
MRRRKEHRAWFSIANRFQRKILTLVFLSTVVPMIIAVVCLYYLTFSIVASEIGIPEAIGYALIPAAKRTAGIAIVGFLVSVVFIWMWAWEVSHRLVGPLDRLCRELDERIAGKKKGYIYFRKKDYLAMLVGRINALLDRLK